MVAQRVVQLHRLELVTAQHVPYTGEETLRTQHRGILAVDHAVVLVVLLDHAAAILRGRTVPEEPRQKLGQRVGLLAEQSQRVESVAGHVEVDAVAQDRRGQRLAESTMKIRRSRRSALYAVSELKADTHTKRTTTSSATRMKTP